MVSIRQKLVATFLTISLFFGLLVTGVYINSLNVSRSFNELSEHSVPQIAALKEMIAHSLTIYSRAVEYTVEDNTEELDEYLAEIQHAKDGFSAAYLKYDQIANKESIEETALIREQWNTFALNSDVLIGLVQRGGASDENISEAREEAERSQEEFQATLEKTLATRLAQNEIMKATVDSNEDSLFTLIVTAIAASVLFSTGLGLLVSRKILNPLTTLKSCAVEVAKGNYETEIPKLSDDELGDLATQFDKMKKELGEKDRMQKEFVMVASHELKTPIQPILGFAELGLQGKVPAQDALKTIQIEARRLKQLSDDILDVSKIESDKMNYDKKDVNIQELAKDVVSSLKSSLPANVSVVEELSAGNILVEGDSSRLRQVFTNIVGNAIKFTKEGSITVGCSKLAAVETLEIKISDTGTGISKDVLPRLFGKFVSGGMKGSDYHGTGLGLFICKAIIEAHGGEIHATNNQGARGTTFRILLPIKSMAAPKNSISMS
jgi:signal transduction histidine kinase